MKRISHATIAGAFALLAAGCATVPQGQWLKPGASQADFDRTNGTCQSMASGPGMNGSAGGWSSAQEKRFNECMQTAGWTWTETPEGTAAK